MRQTLHKLILPAMFIGLQIFLFGLSALKAVTLLPAIKAAGNLPSYIGYTACLLLTFGSFFVYVDYYIIRGWLEDMKGHGKR